MLRPRSQLPPRIDGHWTWWSSRCAGVNAQERSAAGQMILDSAASCFDQLRRARVSGIPDIDDQQSAAPWLGEATFHLLGDVDGKPEVLDDAGDAPGGRWEAMPLICVRSAAVWRRFVMDLP